MTDRERVLRRLKAGGAARIEAAVRAAERRTRAELVPAVALQSAPMGHAPLLAAALLLLAWRLAGFTLWGHALPWGHAAAPWLDAASLAGLGLWLGGRPRLRALLTPAADRAQAVDRAAVEAFRRFGLDGTKGRTGVLIYVSLAEHQAVVLADQAIAAKLPASAWTEACDEVLKGAAQGDLAAGFERALGRCAAVLQKPFPARRSGEPNELADRLRILG